MKVTTNSPNLNTKLQRKIQQFTYLFLILAITVEGLSLIPSSEKHFNQSMNPVMNINLSKALAEKFL